MLDEANSPIRLNCCFVICYYSKSRKMTEANERDKFKRMRAVYKGSVTKTTGKIQVILQKDIEDEERTKLIALKNNIVDKPEKIKNIDEKLQSILIEEESDAYEKEATGILDNHEQFYELFVTIDSKITIKEEIYSNTTRSVSSEGSLHNTSNHSVENVSSNDPSIVNREVVVNCSKKDASSSAGNDNKFLSPDPNISNYILNSTRNK